MRRGRRPAAPDLLAGEGRNEPRRTFNVPATDRREGREAGRPRRTASAKALTDASAERRVIHVSGGRRLTLTGMASRKSPQPSDSERESLHEIPIPEVYASVQRLV